MIKSKEKIISAAIVLFNKNTSFNLEDVAQLAGVSRRTLHRYFTGKDQLLDVCKETTMAICNAAMVKAYSSTDDILKKLEAMLYAVIDTGSNSVFVKKFYERSSYSESEGNNDFKNDDIKSKWFNIIMELQGQNIISRQLSIAWIFNLFGSIADVAILAVDNGDIAKNDARHFAWFSFSNGIGIKKA